MFLDKQEKGYRSNIRYIAACPQEELRIKLKERYN